MSDFKQRLKNEQKELRERIEKLRAFIWDGHPEWFNLCQVDQHLLVEQLAAMREYSKILERRLIRPPFDVDDDSQYKEESGFFGGGGMAPRSC